MLTTCAPSAYSDPHRVSSYSQAVIEQHICIAMCVRCFEDLSFKTALSLERSIGLHKCTSCVFHISIIRNCRTDLTWNGYSCKGLQMSSEVL